MTAGVPEQPTDNTAMCWIHHVEETQTADSFKACGECWHVWSTEEAFRDDLEQWGPVPPFDEVYSCPLCAHDF